MRFFYLRHVWSSDVDWLIWGRRTKVTIFRNRSQKMHFVNGHTTHVRPLDQILPTRTKISPWLLYKRFSKLGRMHRVCKKNKFNHQIAGPKKVLHFCKSLIASLSTVRRFAALRLKRFVPIIHFHSLCHFHTFKIYIEMIKSAFFLALLLIACCGYCSAGGRGRGRVNRQQVKIQDVFDKHLVADDGAKSDQENGERKGRCMISI